MTDALWKPNSSTGLPPGIAEATACLALEDGRVFWGQSFGARVDVDGEVVFNTSMAGYQEIATDPSYRGQMVVLTHPQVGNYGVQLEASESSRPWLTALIVRDLAQRPNHWLAHGALDSLLADVGIPGLSAVDTRALTRHLRTYGTMRAVLGQLDRGKPLQQQAEALVDRARHAPLLSDKPLVAEVSDPPAIDRRTARPFPGAARSDSLRVALVDLGAKHNIARSLAARGAVVLPVGWDADADAVLSNGAQGVVISNGPGDPERMENATRVARELWRRSIPTLGICLGHQVFGLAAGGTTSRLKFGHHGGNHPVRDELTGRIHITSQNHEFQVDGPSVGAATGFFVSAVNLNDGSVEGLAHRELPVFSVQYHPEGCPGPQDNQLIFDRFLAMVSSPVAGVEALARTLSAGSVR